MYIYIYIKIYPPPCPLACEAQGFATPDILTEGATSERGRLPVGNLSLTGTGNPAIQKTSNTRGLALI